MMTKTDIYDYLAKIYLDNSKGKVKAKRRILSGSLSKVFFKLGLAFVIVSFIVASSIIYGQSQHFSSHPSKILISPQINKLGLNNFNSAKREIAKFDLKDVSFAKYRTLQFSARKSNYQDKLLIRVELADEQGGRAQATIDKLPTFKWLEYKIQLNDFQGKYNRTKVHSLVFLVDDWKTKEERGTLYIDNICLLR